MEKKQATIALHQGYEPKDGQTSIAVPLYANTAYAFEDAKCAVDLFDLKRGGYLYTRLNNPTTQVLEERLAAYEGGVGAVATSCGMSAISTALLTLLKSGDHIVASSSLYGGTFNLLSVTLPRLGITTTFVDANNLEEVEAAIRPSTKVICTEVLGNPKLDFIDVDKLSEVARKHQIPLLVDNTLTPSTYHPIEHGADIVVHSLTKYICGNGTALGGIVIDAGKFDWGCGKYPDFTEPSPGYHGLKYWETFGNQAFAVRLRVEGLRDWGTCISPYNAFNILQGLETLDVRFKHISDTALQIAEWLQQNDLVEWVAYPGLKEYPHYELSSRQLKRGGGGILTFGPKGGAEAARIVSESTKLFKLVANLGDSKSLIIHPASTTHRQLTAEQQLEAGVTPDLIRLAIGLEDVEDLKEDLQQALLKAQK